MAGNGPAYPTRVEHRTHGISTRDYVACRMPGFAPGTTLAQALESVGLKDLNPPADAPLVVQATLWAKAEALYRYIQADAMLEARHGRV